MDKKPVPAPLERIEGILRSSTEGPVAVVALMPGTRSALTVRNLERGIDSVGAYSYLALKTDSEGTMKTREYRSEGGMTLQVPAGEALAVANSHEGDGFVLYEPLGKDLGVKLVFREMLEAPESGYAGALELPDDSRDRIYFYCRIGGMYGKGMIVRPYVEQEEGQARALAVVNILVNPTGSRYVATDE